MFFISMYRRGGFDSGKERGDGINHLNEKPETVSLVGDTNIEITRAGLILFVINNY